MKYKIHPLSYEKFIDHAFSLSAEPHSFWCDSGSNNHPYGRYSFVGCHPYKLYAPKLQGGSIFDILKADISVRKQKTKIPFLGGFVGYFSYDFGLTLLGLAAEGKTLTDIPDYSGGLYDVCLYADHQAQKSGLIITNLHPIDTMQQREDFFLTLLEKPFQKKKQKLSLESLWDREAYKDAVQKTRHHIEQGDIFQANIARYFSGKKPQEFCTLSYYAQLRDANMAPFGCYIKGEYFAIMSSSPERFIKITGNHIETRPIKGTLSDEYPAEDLEKSNKDRAENIMIVDMLRNDLAKSSRTGTVTVSELCVTETYEGLHHLVSTVKSKKHPHTHPCDVLKNALPGGSVTGAPKKHACEIISSLEGYKRGGYCGSAGYISFSGDMDMNILIRTVFADQNRLSFGAGCGITYASDADAEYEESVLKAHKILQSFEG